MWAKRGLALGLLLLVASTGCGSKGAAKVATAGGTASASAGAGTLSDQEKAVKYAQCLRSHGIQVADPEDGQLPAIEQGTASEQAVKAATAACRQYLPTGKPRTLDQTQLEKLRQLAKCLREHGFPTFPDPDADQGGIVLDDSAGIDTRSPAFKAAQQQCGMGGPPPSPGASGGPGATQGGNG